MLLREGTIKGEHNRALGCHNYHLGVPVLNIWVYQQQTLYFGYLSVSLGITITKMDSVTCLFICMYPDLPEEHLVIVTLFV